MARHDPAPPSQLTPGLPGEVDYVLARALAKAPADRYAWGNLVAGETRRLEIRMQPVLMRLSVERK